MADISNHERELLRRTALGDQRAFGELVMEHQLRLEAFVLHVTRSVEFTEEIVQDVFLQVWITREGLTEVKKFSDFLFILCRNQTFNAIRKQVRLEARRQKWENDYSQQESETENKDTVIIETLVDYAVNQLPPQQQRAWRLSRRQSKKYEQIAMEMGLSKETVKKHIQLANASIIRYLNEHKELWIFLLLGHL